MQRFECVTTKQILDLMCVANALLNPEDSGNPANTKTSGKLTEILIGVLARINIPLAAANQEISSILQGTIDCNCSLAQELRITNNQVRQWSLRNRVKSELCQRLINYYNQNVKT